MGIVVTGIGPRSGTSAMMRTLIGAGWDPHPAASLFPSYAAPERNPLGYWDLDIKVLLDKEERISLGAKEVVKIWSPSFPQVDWHTVDKIVVMHRNDLDAQMISIKETAKAEGVKLDATAVDRMFWEIRILLSSLNKPIYYVETEELRSDPQAVLRKIKEAT